MVTAAAAAVAAAKAAVSSSSSSSSSNSSSNSYSIIVIVIVIVISSHSNSNSSSTYHVLVLYQAIVVEGVISWCENCTARTLVQSGEQLEMLQTDRPPRVQALYNATVKRSMCELTVRDA